MYNAYRLHTRFHTLIVSVSGDIPQTADGIPNQVTPLQRSMLLLENYGNSPVDYHWLRYQWYSVRWNIPQSLSYQAISCHRDTNYFT